MKLSASARIALRSAITNHSGWDALRRDMKLSLATMMRDDYLACARALGIDVPALIASLPNDDDETTVQSPSAIARAKADFAAPMNTVLDPAQFPARGNAAPAPVIGRAMVDDDTIARTFVDPAAARTATEHDEILRANAAARAKADFDDVETKIEAAENVVGCDPTMPILERPVALTAAQLRKLDGVVSFIDSDVSVSALYAAANSAISLAQALRHQLDNAPPADPRTAALAALTKPSLDFVPPSWSRDFADLLAIGATIAVVGPSGNGKTTGARKLLERSGFVVYEFDCTDATLPQDIIGRTSLRQENGATVTEWTPGPLAKAFADPKGALLLNEYDALDPRTGMALQSALESADTRRCTMPDTGEQITSHGACPIVLTLNTIGHGATVEYQGRNALDGANRDRVEIITTGYEAEREIMIAHGHNEETAERLAKWASDARAILARINSREILSNRRLLTAASLIDRCAYSMRDAVTKAFICRLPEREKSAFTA